MTQKYRVYRHKGLNDWHCYRCGAPCIDKIGDEYDGDDYVFGWAERTLTALPESCVECGTIVPIDDC